MQHRPSHTCRGLVRAVLLLILAAVSSVGAQTLPPLPLPDCAANGLDPSDNFADCEGTLAGYAFPLPQIQTPGPGAVALAISTRQVDFRRDEDRPGSQTITFSFTVPPNQQATGANGTIRAGAAIAWPEEFEDFNSYQVKCRAASPEIWGAGCDAEPIGTGPNPKRILLLRQGTCAFNDTSCTYRITWGPYDRRVRDAMLFRLRINWYFNYTVQLTDGTFVSPCGSSIETGCGIGAGTSVVAVATTPPPPLRAIAVARRQGTKAFEFDARSSTPDVVSYEWTLRYPVTGMPGEEVVMSTAPVFKFDYAEQPGIPAIFFQTTGVAQLLVKDRWNRAAFDFAHLSFLEPVGTEGPLEILSFVLVGVDAQGVATLKAVVKNKSSDPLTDVFLLGTEGQQLISPDSTPQAATIAAGDILEFTLMLKLDARDEFTVQARAFGSSTLGPVKSSPKFQSFTREGGPVGATTVSQASQPGDRTLHVDSNDGFAPGDYVVINVRGENAEIRRVGALGSLIFDAPMAKAHAVGEPVRAFANTVDTTGPTIDVTSPTTGASVCQGAALAAAFTCSEPENVTGVEGCGEGVTNGQVLDTNAVGANHTTIRAWDGAGNLSETTVDWTVRKCGAACESARCRLNAAIREGACADEPVPATIIAKFDKAVTAIETSASQPEKKAKKLRRAARKLLGIGSKAALKAAKGKTPKLTNPCAQAIGSAVRVVVGGLAP